MRIAALGLILPLGLIIAFLVLPGLNEVAVYASTLHFYIVPAASLLAAAICVVLVLSARSIRQTRILFLALCFSA